QQSSKANLDTTRVMNGVVSSLTRQVALLEKEMAGVRYQRQGEKPAEPSASEGPSAESSLSLSAS
ncbi:MAG TPA: hypothetical protein VJ550_04015, partial [Geomonas sp.]|nr:hypothetical protein [Geomonas sp.]